MVLGGAYQKRVQQTRIRAGKQSGSQGINETSGQRATE